jgi:hypothetical protein
MLNDAGGHGGGEKDEREAASEFSSRCYVMIVACPFMADTVAIAELISRIAPNNHEKL